jgi:hypothetical protein
MKKILLTIASVLYLGMLSAGSGKEYVLELQSPPAEGEVLEVSVQQSGKYSDPSELKLALGSSLELLNVRIGTNPGEIIVTVRGKRNGKQLPEYGNPISNPHGIVIVGIDNITGVKVDNGGGVDVTAKDESNQGNNGIEGGDAFNPDPKDDDEDPIVPGQPSQNNPVSDLPEENSTSSSMSSQTFGTDDSRGRVNPETNKQVKGDVSIFPNPADGQSEIVTVGEILMRGVQVYDQSGKPVTAFLPATDGGLRVALDLSQFRPGLYIVMVQTTNNRTITKKLYRR